MPSKLKASDWARNRALLSKYHRREGEFRLNDAHLRQLADGTLDGSLWVRGVTFPFNKFRSNWLGLFEKFLQQDTFPRES